MGSGPFFVYEILSHSSSSSYMASSVSTWVPAKLSKENTYAECVNERTRAAASGEETGQAAEDLGFPGGTGSDPSENG